MPKTAGQSIEQLFLKENNLTWEGRSSLLLKPNNDPTIGPERLAHLYANEYVKFNHISQADFDEFYKFSFVRNPFDRLVSEYKYRRLDLKFSFKTFVTKKLPSDEFTNDCRHIVPQSKYLYDDNRCLVDFVGKFENLQSDFNEVGEAVNLSDSQLPHNNKSKSKNTACSRILRRIISGPQKSHYRDYYDHELKSIVSKMYEADLDNFKYSF